MKIKTWHIAVTIALLASIGLADTLYLSYAHMKGDELVCFIFESCNKVTTSPYSYILGIPVAYLGTLYYSFILVLCIMSLDMSKKVILKMVSYLSIAGFLFSAYFVYIQVAVIKAFCNFCIFSAIISTLIFVVSMLFLSRERVLTKSHV